MRENVPGGREIKGYAVHEGNDKYKKVFCPICILFARDKVMVYLDDRKTWKCNYCQYVVPEHMEPVANLRLVAGNEVNSEKPYCRTVSVRKPRKLNPDTDKFSNPLDAWNAD